MQDTKRLETQYLKAKIEYYEGNPIMTDSEFDALEKILKDAGSKVHEQVGSKRKDFDFTHPTKMLSLSKVQTEKNEDGTTNYMYDEFYTWFSKRASVVGKMGVMSSSPKFDGSAINIIYRDGVLENVLTRGDGEAGKSALKRFKSRLPEKIDVEVLEGEIIEIRCECVVDVNIFNEKYFGKREDGLYANARNFVAGVIGKDKYVQEKVNDLTLIPLHFIVDGVHVPQFVFEKYPEFSIDYNYKFTYDQYEGVIKHFEELRKTFDFKLDGVVISFPESVRKDLGENDHDPEWALAIKFIPEETVTPYYGVEWNVSKRGELCPVILLKPVELDGTTVKRASGYNAGYLVNNEIGPGAILSIAKAGDIIPEVQNVIITSNKDVVLPSECPECKTETTFDGIHLMCPNEKCPGKIAKIIATGSGVLDLKGIGSERLKPFAKDFINIFQIWVFVLRMGGDDLGKYGLEPGTRLNEIFVNAFKNIKSIPYEKIIRILGYENVGRKISQQLAREHAGLDFSYASLERALVDKVHTEEVESYIKDAVSVLETFGVIVDRPVAPKTDTLGVVMTGSPKVFGFKTKKEFLIKYPNLVECSMTDAICKYLITDDLSSTSSKMKAANKKGIEIKTYGDF
jgi:DNA ligase (NAD+)